MRAVLARYFGPDGLLVGSARDEPPRLLSSLETLARVRELTESAAEGEVTPPLTVKAGQALAEAVRTLIEVGRERVVAASL